MIKTVYTCDCCTEEMDREDLFTMELTITAIPGGSYKRTVGSGHYCEECLRGRGFPTLGEKAQVEQKPITTEEAFLDALSDYVAELVGR